MAKNRSIFVASLAALLAAPLVIANQEEAPAPPTYPLLQQLNAQTKSLYKDVQSGVAQVQLPTPKWVKDAAAKDDPLKKWDKVVDPQVKQKLDEQRSRSVEKGRAPKIDAVIVEGDKSQSQSPRQEPAAPTTRPVTPATQPTTQPLGPNWNVRIDPKTGDKILEPRGASDSIVIQSGGQRTPDGRINIGGVLEIGVKPADANFAPNNIGLVLDDGFVLIPIYVEKETIGKDGVPLMIGGTMARATFIASDEKTNVTLLQMPDRARPGRPVRLSHDKLDDGSLVMLLNPNNASARLIMWAGGQRDYGVVVNMDGTIAGFSRFGRFLAAPFVQPVIDQLKRGGVTRPVLGVRLSELPSDSPLRTDHPALGSAPALLVDDVSPGSPARRAGLDKGDLITHCDDQPVGDLLTWSALTARGGQATLEVLHPTGQNVKLKLDLDPSAPKP